MDGVIQVVYSWRYSYIIKTSRQDMELDYEIDDRRIKMDYIETE